MNKYPNANYTSQDLQFLKTEVPNSDGLAIFCHKRANPLDVSKFYRSTIDLLNLSNGKEFLEFAERLQMLFNPLSLFVGFTFPDLPPFKEHNHFRNSLEKYYRYNNVITIGSSSQDGEVLIIGKNSYILDKKFSFTFHNTAFHKMAVISDFTIYFIMDDLDSKLFNLMYPKTVQATTGFENSCADQ